MPTIRTLELLVRYAASCLLFLPPIKSVLPWKIVSVVCVVRHFAPPRRPS